MTENDLLINEYVHHEARHCESACQRNILLTYDYDINESVLFGLDGSFGFSYYPVGSNAVDIIIGKQSIFPMQAAKLIGAQVKKNRSAGSASLKRMMDEHGPVIARVDIGKLPYWNTKGGISFGGYFVNVVKYEQNRFLISDSAFPEPIWVSEQDLESARSSKDSTPINPNHECITFSPPRRKPQLDKVGPVAIRNLCRDVIKPDRLNLGIPGMKKFMNACLDWKKTKTGRVTDIDSDGNVIECNALTRQLNYVGRQIEVYGTGGGLYRPMISEFLAEIYDETKVDCISAAAGLFAQSGKIWSVIGNRLLNWSDQGDADDILSDLTDSMSRIISKEKAALNVLKSV